MAKQVNITSMIHTIRGQRVMLDSDLAKLFEVGTKVLNQACQRNIERFPDDFRFQLTKQELAEYRSQIVTAKIPQRNQNLPYVFTEHGALMAANLLKSKTAVETSVNIVRAFVEMRSMIRGVENLEKKISKLEDKFDKHDVEITAIFKTLRTWLDMKTVENPPKRKIGFIIDSKKK